MRHAFFNSTMGDQRVKNEAKNGSGDHKAHAGQKQNDMANQRICELR